MVEIETTGGGSLLRSAFPETLLVGSSLLVVLVYVLNQRSKSRTWSRELVVEGFDVYLQRSALEHCAKLIRKFHVPSSSTQRAGIMYCANEFDSVRRATKLYPDSSIMGTVRSPGSSSRTMYATNCRSSPSP